MENYKPFVRDTARPHLGRKIRLKDNPAAAAIQPIFAITDEGIFVGTMEGGPFITYAWLLEHCVFNDTDEPCGVKK